MGAEEELFAALQSARLAEVVDDRELARQSRRTSRRIRRQDRHDRWRAGRRWGLAATGGFVVLFAGVGVASAGLTHRQPEHQDLVWCYRYVPHDLTDADARGGVLLLDSEQTTAQNALDACYSNGDGTMGTIPDEVSQCVLPDGSVAVIPVSRCVDLGLPESDAKQTTGE